jgi:hypothetical protein
MLPQLAQGSANKIFVIPSEFSQALGNIGGALASFGANGAVPPEGAPPAPRRQRAQVEGPDAIDEKAAADAAEAAKAAQAAADEAAGASNPIPAPGVRPPEPGPGTSIEG